MRERDGSAVEIDRLLPRDTKTLKRLVAAVIEEARHVPPPDYDGELTDDEMIALAGHLIDFALTEWERGRRKSAVACIAVNLAFQARRTGGKPIASAIAKRLKADARVEEKMRAFLADVGQPPDEWRKRIDLLAEHGEYTAAFGETGRIRISRSDFDNKFIPRFRKYLEGLPTLSRRQYHRFMIGLPLVVSIFLGGCKSAAGVGFAAKIIGWLVAHVKALVAFCAALLAVVAALLLLSRCARCDNDGVSGEDATTITDADPTSSASMQVGDSAWPLRQFSWFRDHCSRISAMHERKACWIEAGDARRGSRPLDAEQLYQLALAVSYDSIPSMSPMLWSDVLDIEALDGLASLYAMQGKYGAAYDVFSDLIVRASEAPISKRVGFHDCAILGRLTREAKGPEQALATLEACRYRGGGAEWNPLGFEVAQTLDAMGHTSAALDAYGSSGGRMPWLVGFTWSGFNDASWRSGRWHFLYDARSALETADARMRKLVDELVARQHAVRLGDIAVVRMPSGSEVGTGFGVGNRLRYRAFVLDRAAFNLPCSVFDDEGKPRPGGEAQLANEAAVVGGVLYIDPTGASWDLEVTVVAMAGLQYDPGTQTYARRARSTRIALKVHIEMLAPDERRDGTRCVAAGFRTSACVSPEGLFESAERCANSE